MRNRMVGTWLLVLAVALIGSMAGCGGGQQPGATTPATPAADYAVKVVAEPSSITVPRSTPSDAKTVFTVTNDGSKADTYILQFTAFGTKWVPEGIPTSATLQPGESKALSVPLTFEMGGSVPGFDIALTATSQGDPTVKGEGACALSFE